MTAPLAGLKVVELARVLAGPWIGQTLADLGAEVIKIESPEGDETRTWGPHFIERDGDRTATYYYATNRGKTGLTADLKTDAGLKKVKDLLGDADVFIENFKVGGLAKYGLDYATLSQTHPRLIYTSVTGFGQTGPYAHRAGYDFLIQGMSGIMDLTGEADGPPQKPGVAFADIFTGLYGVIGIQAALRDREQTGLGQHIDLSLLDTMTAMMANQASSYLATGISPTRMGNAHPSIVPYQVFPVQDGHIIIACGNSGQFQRLCTAIDRVDLAEDTRFATNPLRLDHRDELVTALTEVFSNWHRDELLAACEAQGVPAAPINTLGQALEDPHIKARGLRISPEGIAALRTPLKFSRSTLTHTKTAPKLGRDD
ncbi:CaiB/BaiF CoA transferase family protein [Shimia ponticola]|uniref:CaiB/BaiF CoA transferase family protein n=1 Tax=Shimia ponticola TaxID=2582893 RepID=UPI0011BE1C54|nr:CaiB/BaiF CoA-transferase family protein [Shimia ponticola]